MEKHKDMINKRLFALSIVFFALAIFTGIAAKMNPKPVAIILDTMLDGMEQDDITEIEYNIESVEIKNARAVQFNGWALVTECNSADICTVFCVIGSDETKYAFESTKMQRTDVAEAFENTIYDMAGFTAVCDMIALPTDTYSVYLYMLRANANKWIKRKMPYSIEFDGKTSILLNNPVIDENKY